MGILERLETVIKSYLGSEDRDEFKSGSHKKDSDPDLKAAYEELDDFLRDKNQDEKSRGRPRPNKKEQIPDEIRKDLAELGLAPGAGADECREAYKKLLKIHHPDRHAKHEGNMRKATAKTARVNASYERLEKWFTENP